MSTSSLANTGGTNVSLEHYCDFARNPENREKKVGTFDGAQSNAVPIENVTGGPESYNGIVDQFKASLSTKYGEHIINQVFPPDKQRHARGNGLTGKMLLNIITNADKENSLDNLSKSLIRNAAPAHASVFEELDKPSNSQEPDNVCNNVCNIS
jgi:hypothetical protein